MDKNKQAYEQLKKGIESFVEQAINNAPITRIENGLVLSKGTKQGYKIKINSVTYDNILVLNEHTFNTNDVVKIVVPNGAMNNMFILGKLS